MLSNTYVSNGITYQACPDCPVFRNPNSTTVYNCTSKCKITACPDKQKLNDAETACVDKDDNCPNDYYKSCETGIETTVTPKYTEAGTACYQCKPKPATCPIGQVDTEKYWCAVPKTIDCNALGYKHSSGSCGSLSKIACPFDASKFACIDFN